MKQEGESARGGSAVSFIKVSRSGLPIKWTFE